MRENPAICAESTAGQQQAVGWLHAADSRRLDCDQHY